MTISITHGLCRPKRNRQLAAIAPQVAVTIMRMSSELMGAADLAAQHRHRRHSDETKRQRPSVHSQSAGTQLEPEAFEEQEEQVHPRQSGVHWQVMHC